MFASFSKSLSAVLPQASRAFHASPALAAPKKAAAAAAVTTKVAKVATKAAAAAKVAAPKATKVAAAVKAAAAEAKALAKAALAAKAAHKKETLAAKKSLQRARLAEKRSAKEAKIAKSKALLQEKKAAAKARAEEAKVKAAAKKAELKKKTAVMASVGASRFTKTALVKSHLVGRSRALSWTAFFLKSLDYSKRGNLTALQYAAEQRKALTDAQIAAFKEQAAADKANIAAQRALIPKAPLTGYMRFAGEFAAANPAPAGATPLERRAFAVQRTKNTGLAWRELSKDAQAAYNANYAAERAAFNEQMKTLVEAAEKAKL